MKCKYEIIIDDDGIIHRYSENFNAYNLYGLLKKELLYLERAFLNDSKEVRELIKKNLRDNKDIFKQMIKEISEEVISEGKYDY